MKMKPGYFWSLWKNNPWSRLYFFFFFLFLIPIPVLILSITIFYRLPCITKVTEEMKSSILLRNEIEKAKAAWSEKEMKIAMTNWDDVRKRVPGSYEAVSEWISDLNRLVSLKGFKMSYNLGELKPAYNGAVDLSLLPIILKLTVPKVEENQTKSIPTGISQFIELLYEIVTINYGTDLSGVVVTGTGNGIKAVDVSINLWVGFGSKSNTNKEA